MLDSLLRPVASRWAAMFPDTSALAQSAAAAGGDRNLWAGPVMSPKALEDSLLSALGWGSFLLVAIAVFLLYAAHGIHRARRGNPIMAAGFGPMVTFMVVGTLCAVMTGVAYAEVDRDAGRVALITSDGSLEYRGEKPSDTSASRIRSVTFCVDCPYVRIATVDGNSVAVSAEGEGLESLRAAAAKVVGMKP